MEFKIYLKEEKTRLSYIVIQITLLSTYKLTTFCLNASSFLPAKTGSSSSEIILGLRTKNIQE